MKFKIITSVVLVGAMGVIWFFNTNYARQAVPIAQPQTTHVFTIPFGDPALHEVVTVVELDQNKFRARVANDQQQPKFVSEWLGAGTGAAMNGEYFDTDNAPSGFLVVRGVRSGARQFDQDKSGLVSIHNGLISIRDLSREPLQPNETFEYALQSYPFLIRDYGAALTRDTGYKARRSAIGLDSTGNVFLIITDAPDLSLYAFMNALLASHLSLRTVLNLDGGPSSGLAFRAGGDEVNITNFTPVPNALIFEPR